MQGHSGRPPFAPSSSTEDPRNNVSSSINSCTSLGLRGRRVVIIRHRRHHHRCISNQHRQRQIIVCERTRLFSGTLSPSHVPYRVSVSSVGHVDERNTDPEEEEQEEEEAKEEEQVVGSGGGTLPIHINTSPPQFRGGYPLDGRQSPGSLPPLSGMFGSCASLKSPSSSSRLSSPPTSITPNYPSNASMNANANTVVMPILTREHINQIESETGRD